MIYLIKNNMSEYVFNVFMRDFKKLNSIKGSAEWVSAKKRLNRLNRSFDSLGSLTRCFNDLSVFESECKCCYCNYTLFKDLVLEMNSICDRLDQFSNSKEREAIELFYTIDVYIGLLTEYILTQKLLSLGYKIDRNYRLDRLGIDFICGNHPFQMKNYSFLLDTSNMTEYIKKHKELTTLNFIFYGTVGEEIGFYVLNDMPYTNISEIDGFTIHREKKFFSFNDFVSLLTSTIDNE